MKILYIGWVGAGNVGDELMLDNFKELIDKKFKGKHTVFAKMCNENYDDFDDFDLICLGGGSILADGFINIMHRALKKGKKIMIWGSAYDGFLSIDDVKKIDKYKIAYIYPDTIEEKLYDISKGTEYFSVRGPITYSILEGSNIDMENIVLSGDPGFLLQEGTSRVKLFKKEDKVVAINVGTALNRIYGSNEKEVMDSVRIIAKKLLSRGYKLYLYSVWKTDTQIVVEFYNSMKNTENIILDMDIRSGSELLSIISECVFTLNFKLHSNIISAVAGVPFIALCYRVKGYDFAKSIDCEFLTIKTDSKQIVDEALGIINKIEKEHDKISNHILENIEKYKLILDSSLDFLDDIN